MPVILIAVIILMYFYGITFLPFRGEEANRFLTAYEMFRFGDPFNPTHLGQPYYLKPPLFMDVEILFAYLFGWHWWVGRLVSIVSTLLTALLVYLLGKELFRDGKVSLLAAIAFLTLGDIAVFYGFVAEIDAFRTFLFTLGVYLFLKLLRSERENFAFALGGFFTALGFLTKGFPALYHYPLSFLLILTLEGELSALKRPSVWLSYFATLGGVLSFWMLNLKSPTDYLSALWGETFKRVENSGGLERTLTHLLTYPLLTFKQLLPYSLILPVIFGKKESRFAEVLKRENLLLLALIVLNYLPYWLSAAGRGRYALIVFPFVALLLARYGYGILHTEVKNKPFKLLSLALFFVALYPLAVSFEFFQHYGLWQLVFLIPLGFSIFRNTLSERTNLLTLFVTLSLVFKVGFVNFAAPHKEKKNPARPIAESLSKVIPKGSTIRYLPKGVYMELCAYLDAFTKGVVLRDKGVFFLTNEKNLPPKGYKILKAERGWIVGKFLNGGEK